MFYFGKYNNWDQTQVTVCQLMKSFPNYRYTTQGQFRDKNELSSYHVIVSLETTEDVLRLKKMFYQM